MIRVVCYNIELNYYLSMKIFKSNFSDLFFSIGHLCRIQWISIETLRTHVAVTPHKCW